MSSQSPYIMVGVDKIQGADYRQDIGDITALVASIKERGMLAPLIITPDLLLLAGQRRLAAYREIGWTIAPAIMVADLTEALRLIQSQGDICQAPMNLFDQVRLGLNLETLDGLVGRHSPSREAIAAMFGISAVHYHRARVITLASRSALPAIRRVAEAAMMDILVAGHGVRTGYDQVLAAKAGRPVPPLVTDEPAPLRGEVRRVEQLATMRELAATGMTAGQIGAEMGLSRSRVLVVAKRAGLRILGEVAIHKTHHVNSDRVIRETVHTLDGLASAAGLVDVATIDPVELPQWITSLTDSIRVLNRLLGQMKEQAKEGTEKERGIL
jgi:hypothetical protein